MYQPDSAPPYHPRPFVAISLGALLAALLLAPGCSLEPASTKDERTRLAEAGKPFEQPLDKRTLPPLAPQPSWQDILQRAFLTNGDLEASYFDWKAALARVSIAGSYPNPNITLNYSYLFSGGKMKAWDRTTLAAGFDPAVSLQWPTKVQEAARGALDDAQAKAKRFAAAKFALQQKVLTTWLDYAWLAERIRIQSETVDLLKMLRDSAAQRVRTGGPQQDLLKAQTEYELARNDLKNLQSEAQATRAMLNGLLSRSAEETLLPPKELPAPRPLPADDARLIAVAVDNNPELAALAHEVAGRASALEQARLAYIPDITPQFSITGNASQVAGAMLTLPTNLIKIRGGIQEAQALMRGSEATLRQAQHDRAALFVATLYALRNNERQMELFNQLILPQAKQLLTSSQRAYSGGTIGFAELIDSQRTVLEIRNVIAEARIAREKRLAELEALAGVDAETLALPTTTPSTAPGTRPATQATTAPATAPTSQTQPDHTH